MVVAEQKVEATEAAAKADAAEPTELMLKQAAKRELAEEVALGSALAVVAMGRLQRQMPKANLSCCRLRLTTARPRKEIMKKREYSIVVVALADCATGRHCYSVEQWNAVQQLAAAAVAENYC